MEKLPLQSAAGLPVMATFAEGLPVFFIPEQFIIATVRDDMVDYGGWGQLSLTLAFHTKRMRTQIALPRRLPFAVVSTRRRALSHI